MEQQRQMGLASAIAVVMGESIALGIFLKSAAMAKSLGSSPINVPILLHDPMPAPVGAGALLCGDPIRHFFF